ncbi:MAG: DeoR/GlpR family DNA-binding transcription regulator, partial [Caldilineaceae bacterium]
ALGVSEWTVRRDLDHLKKRGVVARTVAESGITDSLEASGRHNHPAKVRIGRAAAALIHPASHVALSGGSTTLEVARTLRALRFRGYVVTNALDIALELAQPPALRVLCTGGDVQERYHTLVGPVAERVLRLHYYDVAVIGISGATVREGFTVNSQLEATLLTLMIEHAQQVILVADHSKFGRVAFASLPVLAPVIALVTDAPVPAPLASDLERRKIPLIVAQP